jgi:DNA invertase Pin-like site-specific DNA recombinase
MKYLRVSNEDGDNHESDSIGNQRALLDDFISKMLEFEGCEVMEAIDDGRTGTNFNRPGIQKVLDLAERGKIHCIVVKDLSRFGRNYLEVGNYLEQLFPAWNIRFISINDMYDSGNHKGATSGIDIAFRNLIAEMYSQDLSEKIKSSRRNLSISGKICAPYAFFGYRKDPANRHKLIIDEPAAETVRLIFNLYEQGLSTRQLAKKMNTDGVPTASSRQKEKGAKRDWGKNGKVNMWESGAIKRILKDERYTGKHICGKFKCTELRKMPTRTAPKDEWIVVTDVSPAIINDEQFFRVREIMSSKTTSSSSKSLGENLLFYRKIFCGTCGRALSRVNLKSGAVYRCTTHKNIDGLDCMRDSIGENDLIETVLTVIRQQIQLADNKKTQINSVTVKNLHGEIKTLQKLITKIESEKLSLWEQQHIGTISRETYQSENEKLNAQILAYTSTIIELESKETESMQKNVFIEKHSKRLEIKELSKEIVNTFIGSIHVFAHDRIEITLNYVDEHGIMS